MYLKRILYLVALIMLFNTSCSSQPIRLFAGRYTETGGKGLSLLELNPGTGTFSMITEAEAGASPSYFCISKKKNLIYAANEVMDFRGVKGGGVTALKYDPGKGTVEKLKELVVPEGGPCYISLSPKEDYLLFANYSSSSVAVVKLDDNGLPDKVTDSFSFPENVGKVSHPHMISFDREGKKIYLTDLGLDRIVIYDFDGSNGKLKQTENGIVNFMKGAGPRHFEFSSDGTKLYVICELNSTISVFDVQRNGGLSPIQSLSTLSKEYKGESYCADIHIGASGKFLYGSNRGENTIAVFSIGTDGKLESAGRVSCGGNWPRNFVIDPSGKHLLVANQKSGNIVLFNIDQKTGMPVAASKEYNIDLPACLKF
jgi:6-phosphogluconolactonase